MSYINIYDVLPKEIVEQIQESVDGVKVYIPQKADSRKSWGSNTDIDIDLSLRFILPFTVLAGLSSNQPLRLESCVLHTLYVTFWWQPK